MFQPAGDFAFLFTDIKGSTVMRQRAREDMPVALARHDDIGRAAIEDCGGRVVKSMGDGLMAVFTDPRSAIQAALDFQLRLLREPWPEQTPVLVRMGLDYGPAMMNEAGDFQGDIVNQAARVSSAAHGGQVLLGPAIVRAVAKPAVPRGRAVSLGHHRLAGILEAVELFQLAHPGLPRHFGPPDTLPLVADNAPQTDTAFFGRDGTLTELEQALDESRIVSLVGPGGVGKTRLAAEFVKRKRATSKKPARFLVIEPGFDGAAARERLRADSGLGANADPGAAMGRFSLLVLDNCESALDAAAAFANEAAAYVSVLATSTAPLDLTAERIVRLRPLALPSTDATGAAGRQNPSAQLFRWVFARRGGDPDAAEADPEWSRLVERTGGLPLAVQILAASAADIGVGATLAALEAGAAQPTSPFRDTPERHRTLEAAFESVAATMTEPERAILAALAEAPDGLSLGLVGEVAGLRSGAIKREACARLAGKALTKNDSRDGRIELVEALRGVVLARLSSPQVQERFASALVGATAKQSLRLRGASSARALAFFAGNQRNLAKALRLRPMPVAEIAFARWLVDGGRLAEAERSLGPLVDDPDAVVGGTAAALLGNVYRLRQRPDDAYAWCARALAATSEPGVTNYAKSVRLLALMDERRHADAASEAADLLGQPANADGGTPYASALTNVGLMHRKAGRTIEARRLFERAARLHASTRDLLGEARALFNVAVTYFDEMDHESAKPFVEEALDRFRLCRNATGIAHCILSLGDVLYYTGRLDAAIRRYHNSSRRFTQLGHVWMAIASELSVANALYRQERFDEAAALLERLFVDAIGQEVPEHAAHALDTLVGVWSHRGRPDIVYALGLTAQRLRDGAAVDPHCPVPVELFLQRAEDALGPDARPPQPPPTKLLEASSWLQEVHAHALAAGHG